MHAVRATLSHTDKVYIDLTEREVSDLSQHLNTFVVNVSAELALVDVTNPCLTLDTQTATAVAILMSDYALIGKLLLHHVNS